jgi:hypothetical protein
MKDLWNGKSSLTSAFVLLFLGGTLLWAISGLAIVDFVDIDNQVPWYVVLSIRTAFLIFALVAVWRCARNSSPAFVRPARLVVILVALLHVGFLSAVLLPALMRNN